MNDSTPTTMNDDTTPDEPSGTTDASTETTDSTEKTDQQTHRRAVNRFSRFGRRDYLRLTGAAGATVLGVGAIGTATAESYQTITLDVGETQTYSLDDGDTFDNYLFDVSADGAHVNISATGITDWTIRDIGFRGRDTASSINNVVSVKVPTDGYGLIENVYFGDGSDAGDGTPIFVNKDHAGVVEIRRCNIQHWADNGLYGSAPGRDENNPGFGEVHIDQCYSHNNNVDGFRIGSDGSYVQDSVVHVDGTVPTQAGGGKNARGVWVKEGGDCTVRNCDILLEDDVGAYCVQEADNDQGGVARVEECEVDARNGAKGRFSSKYGSVTTRNVGNDPYVAIPAGVPRTASQAADGGSLRKQLEFEGGSSNRKLTYSFATTGGNVDAISANPDDSVQSNGASGQTVGSEDIYHLNGDLKSVSAQYPADGSQFDLEIDRSSRTITFVGGSAGTPMTYYVRSFQTVSDSGDLESSDAVGSDFVKGRSEGLADTVDYTGNLACVWARYPSADGMITVQYNTPG